MASDAQVGEATAYRAIKKAIDAGWLQKSERWAPGRRDLNGYRLCIPTSHAAARAWRKREQADADRLHRQALSNQPAAGRRLRATRLTANSRPGASLDLPLSARGGVDVRSCSLPPIPPAADRAPSASEPDRGGDYELFEHAGVAKVIGSLCDRIADLPASTRTNRSRPAERLRAAIRDLLDQGWTSPDIVGAVTQGADPWPAQVRSPAGLLRHRLEALSESTPPSIARERERAAHEAEQARRSAELAARDEAARQQADELAALNRWFAGLSANEQDRFWTALAVVAPRGSHAYIADSRLENPVAVPPALSDLAVAAVRQAGLDSTEPPATTCDDIFTRAQLELSADLAR